MQKETILILFGYEFFYRKRSHYSDIGFEHIEGAEGKLGESLGPSRGFRSTCNIELELY